MSATANTTWVPTKPDVAVLLCLETGAEITIKRRSSHGVTLEFARVSKGDDLSLTKEEARTFADLLLAATSDKWGS